MALHATKVLEYLLILVTNRQGETCGSGRAIGILSCTVDDASSR